MTKRVLRAMILHHRKIKNKGMRQIADSVAKELLDENGYLKLWPTSELDKIPFEYRRLFCHFYGRYGLPTLELIEWLKDFIKTSSAIEIGAGCGDLGRHLNIPMTDNYCQEYPDVKTFYQLAGQPTIQYGATVEKLDALKAVQKYRPEIVIGQWVTHWIDPDLPVPEGGGNMYGVKEDLLLKECRVYMVIGNRRIHGHKPIMKIPHQEIQAPFLRSRSKMNDDNVIYIWEN